MGDVSRNVDTPRSQHLRMLTFSRRSFLAAATLATPAFADPPPITWRALQPGLEHGRGEIASSIGDKQLHILRIDPVHFRFTLLTSAGENVSPRTARLWARERGLIAATNAAMFRANRLPVGYCKAGGRVIQGAQNNDRSVLTFDDTSARLLDLSVDTFDPNAETNALQGIRMIAHGGRNTWAQQPRQWSIAALAQDRQGRMLFLHARSPSSVHDFIAAIQALPLSLTRAMYLEGGPEATLYVNAGGTEIERVGSYETGFNENDSNAVAWPLPNVIGVVARA